jgi:hypothetical protein
MRSTIGDFIVDISQADREHSTISCEVVHGCDACTGTNHSSIGPLTRSQWQMRNLFFSLHVYYDPL